MPSVSAPIFSRQLISLSHLQEHSIAFTQFFKPFMHLR
jgi:hypothetical protein